MTEDLSAEVVPTVDTNGWGLAQTEVSGVFSAKQSNIHEVLFSPIKNDVGGEGKRLIYQQQIYELETIYMFST